VPGNRGVSVDKSTHGGRDQAAGSSNAASSFSG